MDTGQKLTDEELKKLERRITKEYKTAVKEMEQKLKDYLEETEAGRQVQLQLYRAGKISKDDYENWVYRHTMVGKRWEAMRDTLAADMHKTNEIAKAMSEGQAADVFALNGNYATYQLEHDGKIDTGFTLYNHDTAQYLLEDQRQLMPVPSDKKAREIAANKDMKWNMKKIQSAVLQGVMQGESPYAVAERLEQVGQMNHNSAVRYARTMTTSAQNAGRYEAYRRADKLGVNLSIEWQATLDSRTRHDHRLMHGQRRKVDEPFVLPDGQEILFPADCSHNSYELQGEIWNCRCTLLSWVKGFEGDTVKDSPKMDGMSFEEWQEAKPIPDTLADRKQFADYQELLGKKAPKNLHEFQNIKYNDPEKWEELKQQAQEKRLPRAETPKPKEPPAKSFIEELAESEKDWANFDFAFGENGERNWGGSLGWECQKALEDTIGRLQQRFPMQATNGKEYNCTVDRVILCDYADAHKFLPNGVNDRRLDSEAIAQVFPNAITRDGKEIYQAVIAFNDTLSTKTSLQSVIEHRADRIANGEIVWSLSGYTCPEATAMHEWGHVFSRHVDSAMIHGEQCAQEYWEWYKTLSKDEIRSGISDYAATNRGEFEAECFLEMQMPNPRPLAVKWWGFMQRALELGY